MSHISHWAAAALLATTSLAWADIPNPLRIATEGAYPPFNSVDANGQLVGFDVDIAKALCAEMKANCEIVAQDWDGIIPALVANKYDAIIASMSITDERKQSIDFTNKYYSNYLAVIAPSGGVTGPSDLNRKTVGAQRSTLASQWAEDQLMGRASIKLYDTQTAAYADLQAGRLDAMVSDIYPAMDWLTSVSGFQLAGEKIDINDQIGIGIRQNEAGLKAAFNAAIDAIRTNGVYAEINAKYFSADIY
ncbi:MAG: transporter substrate-binding domain-containing protein [Litorivicinaceae bacterium]|jgi:lysine-arginine-ornithine-binding protein|nr:transporter substrate-binding domain-containing protein [Litorivicinaceae bacterium]MDP5329244.1 transporter substrate-binding domain-containing protein [Litorivicinaceae bacterium]MDP5331245.1 transporter substrate-binding domain-containing protein [Litorivicinaceae bacterium]MDP5339986.1 transporter substrate-binding domain-containing protein [Litorivicinaceae bacterium]MDP5342538.1 transporter substrate-binding domain-containing protein [Litorivicinaceae bacterium]